jgi:hypothetical protein
LYTKRNTTESPATAIFADPHVVHEAGIEPAVARKQDQYKGLLQAVPDNLGKYVAVLPFGMSGFLPYITESNLKLLGIEGKTLSKLTSRINRIAVVYGHSILMTRRKLEFKLVNRRYVSGAFRYELFRKWKKRLLKKEYPDERQVQR